MLTFEQFSQHADNVGKAPGRLQSEYEAYKIRNTPGYGGRGMGDVGGEQLYTGGQDTTGMRDYARQHGMSEDFQRFDEATVQSWEQFRQPNPPDPRKPYLVDGQWVEKPIDSRSFGQGTGVHGPGGGGMGGGGGGGRGGGRGLGALGGAPTFTAPQFTPPSYEDAMSDPGYQFAQQQGEESIRRNAAALGGLRTGGTLQDLASFNQGLASQQYGDVFNRALQTFGTQYQGASDEFAPQYGAWQTQYGGDLSKWTTRYGGDLSKYLQREQNIAGLLGSAPPYYGG